MLGGRAYTALKAALARGEAAVLRDVGFDVYAVSDGHPHRLLLYYCRALGGDAELAGRAWAALNDALRTDLCVRATPDALAAAALLLAAAQHSAPGGFALPARTPWTAVFTPVPAADLIELAGELRAAQAGAGGPPRWLPSLRPDAQPGEDAEEDD